MAMDARWKSEIEKEKWAAEGREMEREMDRETERRRTEAAPRAAGRPLTTAALTMAAVALVVVYYRMRRAMRLGACLTDSSSTRLYTNSYKAIGCCSFL
jgi:hypothetical protein